MVFRFKCSINWSAERKGSRLYRCKNSLKCQVTNAKAYNTYIAPQAVYLSCSGAVHVTDRAVVQPIGRRLSLAHRQTSDQPAIRSPGLPFNGLHPRNPCNYINCYSFTDHGRLEGWVGLVGWPTADTLPTKWSHVNHRSGIDQGKSARQKPTS